MRFAENELRDYIRALGLGDLFNQPMLKLLHQFEEAKNFGSLIQPCLDERAIAFARRAIEAKDSAASSSCARRTSKSCACSNKPRRSPSGITSSWPIRRIWVAAL